MLCNFFLLACEMARAKEVLPYLPGCETVNRILANVTWRSGSFPTNPVGTGIPQGKKKLFRSCWYCHRCCLLHRRQNRCPNKEYLTKYIKLNIFNWSTAYFLNINNTGLLSTCTGNRQAFQCSLRMQSICSFALQKIITKCKMLENQLFIKITILQNLGTKITFLKDHSHE